MAYIDSYGTKVSTRSNANLTAAKVGMTASAAAGVGNAIAQWAQIMREKKIAKENAKIAEQNAQDALYRGRQQQFALRLKQAQVKGTQRARMAANGVALDSATAVDVQASTDLIAGMDAATMENNARREAYGYRVQATNYQAQMAGANPMAAGFGSLMEGAATVASKWQATSQQFGNGWYKNWFSGS
ncbi:hypothetical protein UFOVP821_42 [uncultured Caudovirales phage]|uniref:Internal virion protein n=1 Tax=uncultured Caudovirales phage TaxID=2100421 RepID=A0A6J5PCS5_9CAUD|nr:hypothetical protein UFOVP821_42 [uncultured Caudovirales phage]